MPRTTRCFRSAPRRWEGAPAQPAPSLSLSVRGERELGAGRDASCRGEAELSSVDGRVAIPVRRSLAGLALQGSVPARFWPVARAARTPGASDLWVAGK
jgi:hypothetical protein